MAANLLNFIGENLLPLLGNGGKGVDQWCIPVQKLPECLGYLLGENVSNVPRIDRRTNGGDHFEVKKDSDTATHFVNRSFVFFYKESTFFDKQRLGAMDIYRRYGMRNRQNAMNPRVFLPRGTQPLMKAKVKNGLREALKNCTTYPRQAKCEGFKLVDKREALITDNLVENKGKFFHKECCVQVPKQGGLCMKCQTAMSTRARYRNRVENLTTKFLGITLDDEFWQKSVYQAVHLVLSRVVQTLDTDYPGLLECKDREFDSLFLKCRSKGLLPETSFFHKYLHVAFSYLLTLHDSSFRSWCWTRIKHGEQVFSFFMMISQMQNGRAILDQLHGFGFKGQGSFKTATMIDKPWVFDPHHFHLPIPPMSTLLRRTRSLFAPKDYTYVTVESIVEALELFVDRGITRIGCSTDEVYLATDLSSCFEEFLGENWRDLFDNSVFLASMEIAKMGKVPEHPVTFLTVILKSDDNTFRLPIAGIPCKKEEGTSKLQDVFEKVTEACKEANVEFSFVSFDCAQSNKAAAAAVFFGKNSKSPLVIYDPEHVVKSLIHGLRNKNLELKELKTTFCLQSIIEGLREKNPEIYVLGEGTMKIRLEDFAEAIKDCDRKRKYLAHIGKLHAFAVDIISEQSLLNKDPMRTNDARQLVSANMSTLFTEVGKLSSYFSGDDGGVGIPFTTLQGKKVPIQRLLDEQFKGPLKLIETVRGMDDIYSHALVSSTNKEDVILKLCDASSFFKSLNDNGERNIGSKSPSSIHSVTLKNVSDMLDNTITYLQKHTDVPAGEQRKQIHMRSFGSHDNECLHSLMRSHRTAFNAREASEVFKKVAIYFQAMIIKDKGWFVVGNRKTKSVYTTSEFLSFDELRKQEWRTWKAMPDSKRRAPEISKLFQKAEQKTKKRGRPNPPENVAEETEESIGKRPVKLRKVRQGQFRIHTLTTAPKTPFQVEKVDRTALTLTLRNLMMNPAALSRTDEASMALKKNKRRASFAASTVKLFKNGGEEAIQGWTASYMNALLDTDFMLLRVDCIPDKVGFKVCIAAMNEKEEQPLIEFPSSLILHYEFVPTSDEVSWNILALLECDGNVESIVIHVRIQELAIRALKKIYLWDEQLSKRAADHQYVSSANENPELVKFKTTTEVISQKAMKDSEQQVQISFDTNSTDL